MVSLNLANEPFLGKRSPEEKASCVILSFPLCPAFLADDKWKDRLRDTEFYLVWGVEGEEHLGLTAESIEFRGDLFLFLFFCCCCQVSLGDARGGGSAFLMLVERMAGFPLLHFRVSLEHCST